MMKNKKIRKLRIVFSLIVLIFITLSFFSCSALGKYMGEKERFSQYFNSGATLSDIEYRGKSAESAGRGVVNKAVGLYNQSWGYLIRGEYPDSYTAFKNVNPEYNTDEFFSALYSARENLYYGGSFIGTTNPVDRAVVSDSSLLDKYKVEGNEYVDVFLCNEVKRDEINRIDVNGNAEIRPEFKGWRVFMMKDSGKWSIIGADENYAGCLAGEK